MVEERLTDWISVTDAAALLDVSRQRIRKLLDEGALRSKRIGNQDLVPREDVEARRAQGAAPGRRYSPRRAWALILMASDEGLPPTLHPTTVSKLRKVVRDRDLWSIRPRLSSRAVRRNLRAHSSDLARLDAERTAILTGARHAHEVGLPLAASDAPVELYVDSATAAVLEQKYRLQPTDRPNVILRVVPTEIWRWLPGPIAPRAAVALDLAESSDPRAQQIAQDALIR